MAFTTCRMISGELLSTHIFLNSRFRSIATSSMSAMHTSYEICEYHWKTAIWQTCNCLSCQPHLHKKVLHPADSQQFNFLRGLTWRGHDAWRIACLTVSSFTGLLRNREKDSNWIAWTKNYQFSRLGRASAKFLDEDALNEVIEVFSDIYFLGQLPSSKIRVHWSALDKNQLGFLQPGFTSKDPMILWLNCDHSPLRNCAGRILCVVLHEMAHAFFDYYSCYPWSKPTCARGTCGKLYHLNVGMTGHGRAWQYLVHNIQKAMPQVLGFEGDLGRRAGMYHELEAGACIPCCRDVKLLYPWSPSRWWEWTVRTRDDDAVLHIRLSTKAPRNRAMSSHIPRHERRNSI